MLSTIQKNILIKFIFWLLTGLFITFFGISHSLALTNNQTLFFYNNNGSSATSVSTNYIQTIDRSEATFTTNANSYGGLVVIASDKPLISGHIYTVFLQVGAESGGGYTTLSSKNCVGVGTNLNDAVYGYTHCNITPRFSNYANTTGEKNRGVYYTFIADRNGSYFAIPYSTQYTCTNCLQYSYGYEITDAGDSNLMTQSQVNNVINQQTNNINSSITNTENALKGAISDTENNIITNQNELLGTKCENLIDVSNLYSGGLDNTTGTLINPSDSTINSFNSSTGSVSFTTNIAWRGVITDFIPVESSAQYTINYTSDKFIRAFAFQYDLNKNYLGSSSITMFEYSATLLSNAKFIRVILETNTNNVGTVNVSSISLSKGSSSSFCEYGIYSSKIDTTNSQLEEQNKTSKGILSKLSDLFNSFTSFVSNIFDTSGPDTDSIQGMAGWLPAGPVDSILNLPLTFLNNITSGLSTSCHEVSLPLPYVSTNLVLPCFTTIVSSINGANTFWIFVGSISSVLLLYYYLKALYVWIDKKLSMNEDTDWGGV